MPAMIIAPIRTMPWIELAPDMSGVWSVAGTLLMTSKPTRTASTKMASEPSSPISPTSVLTFLVGRLSGHGLSVARDVRSWRGLGFSRRRLRHCGDLRCRLRPTCRHGLGGGLGRGLLRGLDLSSSERLLRCLRLLGFGLGLGCSGRLHLDAEQLGGRLVDDLAAMRD